MEQANDGLVGYGDSVVIKNILRTVVVVCLPAPDNG